MRMIEGAVSNFNPSVVKLFILELWLSAFFKSCWRIGTVSRSIIRSYISWRPSFCLIEPIVPALPALFDAEYDSGNFLQMATLKSALSIVCTWHVLIEETTWYVSNFTKQLMIYKNAICSHSLWTSAVYYRIFITENFSLMIGTKLTLLSRPPSEQEVFVSAELDSLSPSLSAPADLLCGCEHLFQRRGPGLVSVAFFHRSIVGVIYLICIRVMKLIRTSDGQAAANGITSRRASGSSRLCFEM